MDLVFAIGPSRVITHRVPLHGEFSVRLLDLVLVGVPLEPEDVVEVLASAAAPHVSRLLVKRFPPIGRVFLFLLPPSRPSRRGEPAGNAWAEPTREARYGGRRVLKAVRARGGRRCVRWVCATPPRSPLLPARPRKKSVALVPVRSWQWTAAASKKRTFIHGRDTRASHAKRSGAPSIHLRATMSPPAVPADGPVPAAVDGGDGWTACFRDCCRSDRVNLAVPKHEFAANLLPIHDGPASAVFLGRFGDKAVAVKKPKLPTKVRVRLVRPSPSRAKLPATHSNTTRYPPLERASV